MVSLSPVIGAVDGRASVGRPARRIGNVLDLRPTPYDHPDSVRLTTEVQAFYRERYGDEDVTPIDPSEFASPRGFFVVGYADGAAVACGGWRARDGGEAPEIHEGDAEIKRMYVTAGRRGRGHARAVLAELERCAVGSGRTRAILETGTRQPEAIALYVSAGYAPMPKFGVYRDEPDSRCYAKWLLPFAPGQRIRWVPPTVVIRRTLPDLHPDHPGVVADIGPRHVLVDWVDRSPFSRPAQSALDAEWLAAVDDAEFARLTRTVRERDAMQL